MIQNLYIYIVDILIKDMWIYIYIYIYIYTYINNTNEKFSTLGMG